MYLFR